MDNHNSISYADGWKNSAEPIRRETTDETQKPEIKSKNKLTKGSKPLLTIIQIIICLLIVLTAYVFKTFGGDLFNEVKKSYENEINNEIILNPYENDLDKIFNAAKD